jgi:hypothetical protein
LAEGGRTGVRASRDGRGSWAAGPGYFRQCPGHRGRNGAVPSESQRILAPCSSRLVQFLYLRYSIISATIYRAVPLLCLDSPEQCRASLASRLASRDRLLPPNAGMLGDPRWPVAVDSLRRSLPLPVPGQRTLKMRVNRPVVLRTIAAIASNRQKELCTLSHYVTCASP